MYVYLLYRLGYSSNVRALSKRLRNRECRNVTQKMRDADSDADRCYFGN